MRLLRILLLVLAGCCVLAHASPADDEKPASKSKSAAASSGGGGGGGASGKDSKDADDEPIEVRDTGPWIKETDYVYLAPMGVFALALAGLVQRQRGHKSATSDEFRKLRNEFLLGYGLCVSADWM